MKRLLCETAREKENLEKRYREMVEREIKLLRSWNLAVSQLNILSNFLLNNDVTWDIGEVNFAKNLGFDWALHSFVVGNLFNGIFILAQDQRNA